MLRELAKRVACRRALSATEEWHFVYTQWLKTPVNAMNRKKCRNTRGIYVIMVQKSGMIRGELVELFAARELKDGVAVGLIPIGTWMVYPYSVGRGRPNICQQPHSSVDIWWPDRKAEQFMWRNWKILRHWWNYYRLSRSSIVVVQFIRSPSVLGKLNRVIRWWAAINNLGPEDNLRPVRRISKRDLETNAAVYKACDNELENVMIIAREFSEKYRCSWFVKPQHREQAISSLANYPKRILYKMNIW